MIAIVNIDPAQRQAGPHMYEIRINHRAIATFVHYREDDLSTLLERAARAVAGSQSTKTKEDHRT